MYATPARDTAIENGVTDGSFVGQLTVATRVNVLVGGSKL
jgi:hypothetical protein